VKIEFIAITDNVIEEEILILICRLHTLINLVFVLTVSRTISFS
jgi:hypothetical protein